MRLSNATTSKVSESVMRSDSPAVTCVDRESPRSGVPNTADRSSGSGGWW